jgi:hypothetical protein
VTGVSDLADAVLPLIRTRADIWRWSAANEHGRRMNDAVEILERAAEIEDPALVFAVTQKAISSALKVIMRADDSSGIIVDAPAGVRILMLRCRPITGRVTAGGCLSDARRDERIRRCDQPPSTVTWSLARRRRRSKLLEPPELLAWRPRQGSNLRPSA